MIRLAFPNEAEAIRVLVRAAYGRWFTRFGREPSPMLDDYAQRIAGGPVWVLDAGSGDVGRPWPWPKPTRLAPSWRLISDPAPGEEGRSP